MQGGGCSALERFTDSALNFLKDVHYNVYTLFRLTFWSKLANFVYVIFGQVGEKI
jgi:hypothetical protein